MNYFTYLFSDKKALKYWLLLLIIVITYAGIGILANYEGRNTNWISIIFNFVFILFLFFGFYSTTYLNYLKRNRFLKFYSHLIDQNSFRKCEVLLFNSTYYVTAIKTNFAGKIKPKPKFETFETFRIDDKIGILGYTYDLGVFKRHIPPILVDIKNYENSTEYKYAKTPKISSINWNENDMEIIFERSVYGIDKIKLIGWKNDMKTNSR